VYIYIHRAPRRLKTQRHSEDRELNQAKSKPDPIKATSKYGNVVHTDAVFDVLDSERRRWNPEVETVRLVNNDRNVEASLLEVFTRQLVAIQV